MSNKRQDYITWDCSVGCSVVQGQVKRCGRCCGGFGLSFAAFAGQHLDGLDRKSTRLNSSHWKQSRMPSSA